MKVILLKDVAKIGRRFDVVTVPDGFALNKLIPKGMAEGATPENLKRLSNLSSKMEHDRSTEATAFNDALSALKDIQVSIVVEANNEGRMFQALKPAEIVVAVKEATGFTLGTEQIVMKVPIKSLGEHEVELVGGGHHGVAKLHLVSKSTK